MLEKLQTSWITLSRQDRTLSSSENFFRVQALTFQRQSSISNKSSFRCLPANTGCTEFQNQFERTSWILSISVKALSILLARKDAQTPLPNSRIT
jgi:hypothetical protein